MHLDALWRYPVKSMAGEPLTAADIGLRGITRDRLLQVHDRHGRVITARSHPALLAHRATIDAEGEVRVDGQPWRDAQLRPMLEGIAGPGATLEEDDGERRFDILPLLVATDGALAAFGRDPRRLRPNLVIGGVEGLAERGWPGSRLRIGALELLVHSVRERCVMTTYDPDTQARDLEVLRDIRRRFDGKLALDVEVLTPGRIALGDRVELLPGLGDWSAA